MKKLYLRGLRAPGLAYLPHRPCFECQFSKFNPAAETLTTALGLGIHISGDNDYGYCLFYSSLSFLMAFVSVSFPERTQMAAVSTEEMSLTERSIQ